MKIYRRTRTEALGILKPQQTWQSHVRPKAYGGQRLPL
jgi:hypothetical protein